MSEAGREEAVSAVATRPEPPPEVIATAERYLAEADGDARAALVLAVADGFATAALVSRGFARWGMPTRHRTR